MLIWIQLPSPSLKDFLPSFDIINELSICLLNEYNSDVSVIYWKEVFVIEELVSVLYQQY